MPVHNGAAFVGRALKSVLAQGFRDLRVWISVDRSSDASLEACRRFEADPRARVFPQRERLGRVANTNALLSRVDTDYFFVMPQDDVLKPDYVEALHAELERSPAAVLAYSDLGTFGAQRKLVTVPPVLGDLERRLVAFLLRQMAPVAFRGLVARRRLAAPVLLRHNPADDFGADTLWLLELACAGELRRVEGVRYAKRLHEASETQRWASRSQRARSEGWLEHCVQCASIALDAAGSDAARALVAYAAAARMRQWHPALVDHANVAALPDPEWRLLWQAYMRRTRLPADFAKLLQAAGSSGLARQLPPALAVTTSAAARRESAQHHARGLELLAAKRAGDAEAQFRRAYELAPERAAPFVEIAKIRAMRATAPGAPPAPPPAAPPAAHAKAPELAISVIVCSIDAAKRKRIRAEYERLFAGRRLELVQIADAKSLAEAYNRGFARSSGEIVVFSHDDIEVMNDRFADRLLAHFARSDLVGAAGTSRLAGLSWARAYSPYLHGCVVHSAGRTAYSFDFYGPGRDSGIQALDGMFFAARRRVCEALPFDEKTFDGFHGYDLDFSFRAHLAGFRVGVAADLLLLHQSRGKFDARWQHYGERLMEKHAAHLLVDSPARKTDWPTLHFESRAAALEYHRLMQEASKGL
jgi:GT2 family glycosyltransferase